MFNRHMSKPLVLITNDDGVLAPGIRAVAEALREIAEVVVAAPDRERSAASHSISLDRPLRVDEIEDGTYAIDGTPVDCVYFALLHLCDRPPALVCLGINAGFNLGSDVLYSGTVGGAAAGYLRACSCLAVSAERSPAGPFWAVPVVVAAREGFCSETQETRTPLRRQARVESHASGSCTLLFFLKPVCLRAKPLPARPAGFSLNGIVPAPACHSYK
jgi:hypothetical protein